MENSPKWTELVVYFDFFIQRQSTFYKLVGQSSKVVYHQRGANTERVGTCFSKNITLKWKYANFTPDPFEIQSIFVVKFVPAHDLDRQKRNYILALSKQGYLQISFLLTMFNIKFMTGVDGANTRLLAS